MERTVEHIYRRVMQRTVMVHYQVNGIVLPKHVAAIVKITKYTNQCIFWLISALFSIVLLRSSSHADLCLSYYYLVRIFVTCCVLF
jgi:nicotinamide riboside transporter PnuC